VDIFLFLFLTFMVYSGQGVEKFDEELSRYRRQMAAFIVQPPLATSSSVSRFLQAVEEGDSEDVESYVLLWASGAKQVLAHPVVQHRDGWGNDWHVFDLDPTSTVLRRRSLPEGHALPERRRRADELRAGYSGLFATDVSEEAYRSPEVVSFYDGGGGGIQNRFLQEDRELVHVKSLQWSESPSKRPERFIPVFGKTPALRQRRRQTWEERLRYNALPEECSLKIRLEGTPDSRIPLALAAGAQVEV